MYMITGKRSALTPASRITTILRIAVTISMSTTTTGTAIVVTTTATITTTIAAAKVVIATMYTITGRRSASTQHQQSLQYP
jgi:hypothetical protein